LIEHTQTGMLSGRIARPRLALLALATLLAILLLAACQPAGARVQVEGSTPLYTAPFASDRASACIDLDQGRLTASGQADMCIEAGGGSLMYYYLTPANGARKYLFGETAPVFEDCAAVLSQYSSTNIPDYPAWPNICVLTNQNRLARVTITSIGASLSSGLQIRIQYTTWSKVQNVATATPIIMCTPPPCDPSRGENYYCPEDCPGGCGTVCATSTPEK
jgi:hypothetical protein